MHTERRYFCFDFLNDCSKLNIILSGKKGKEENIRLPDARQYKNKGDNAKGG